MRMRDAIAKSIRRLNASLKTPPQRSQRIRRRLLVENMEERRLLAIDLQGLTASDGSAFYGAKTGDWSGTTVGKTGDINGDGFDDMFIGAVYGDSGSKADAGASYLLFGGPALPATLDLANLASAGVKILGAEAGDASGAWITAADLNADGYDDLIIGSPSADGLANNRSSSGETYIVFGSASLPNIIDLSAPGSAGLTVYGAEADDQSGSAVAGLGDVNGDGYDDFIIGASQADGLNNSKTESGESYLIYGGATLPTTIDLAALQASQGTVFLGVDAGDGSGVSVSGAGDINADGYNDVLIGAVKADGIVNTAQTDDTGEAYLIYGGTSLPSLIALGSLASMGVTIYGAVPNTLTGIGLSGAGDVNGDGFDDFLVGTYLSDGPGNNKFAVGAANLIFGGASLGSTINLATLGTNGVIFYGEEYYDLAGWAVSSAGDLNDDGLDDLLIGATYARAPGDALYTYAGKTYVVYGSTTLSSSIDLASLGTSGFPIYGADPGDISGWSVSGAGDVNGDGFSDFLIGAPNADAASNLKPDAGESYLLYGGRQSSAVTHPGTIAPETLTGTSAADKINGARGDDTLISAGGADVLFGGEGNDVFALRDLNFGRITGGNGSDTLRLDGSGMTLDLTAIKNNRLRGIEQIDITGSGNNTLILNPLELLNLSDESNTLLVRRNAGDTVNFGSGWIIGGTERISGVMYQVYTLGSATLKLQLTNQAPTAIVLSNVISSIAENTATTTRIKVADLVVIDDGNGVNTLTVSGPDAANFEIDSGALYLKAATVIDYETKTTYSINLEVDDPTVGSNPDASAAYVLNVTDVNEPVVLTVANSTVTGMILSTLTNTGTWSDPEGGSVTMSASVGTVIMNSNGTWSWSYVPPVGSMSTQVAITAADTSGTSQVTFNVNVAVPPTVTNMILGDGTNQRSMVSRIEVQFNTEVMIEPNAFSLARRVSGAFTAIPTANVSINLSAAVVSGKTIAVLTFSGSEIIGSSLADGNYRFRIDSSRVTAFGNNLDGDGNGSPGGDYVIGELSTDRIFRFFGDSDGNRRNNALDYSRFQLAYGTKSTDAKYNAIFDYQSNSIINALDYSQFSQRYGTLLIF